VVSGEWSIVLALHCSCNVIACPHALQALTTLSVRTSCMHMMALTSDALETCVRALEIYVPSYIGRSASLFFMLESRGPQRAVGHMAVSEPALVRMRGPEPWSTW
jgi:hypothetical protein